MKVNDLMIGDWVINPVHNDYSKIESVYYDKELHCLVGTDGRFPQQYFNPIPLTAEILSKNGFVYKETIYCSYEVKVYSFPNDKFWSRGFGVEVRNGEYMITDHYLMRCKYVHELQHALRLCGLTELADNFKV